MNDGNIIQEDPITFLHLPGDHWCRLACLLFKHQWSRVRSTHNETATSAFQECLNNFWVNEGYWYFNDWYLVKLVIYQNGLQHKSLQEWLVGARKEAANGCIRDEGALPFKICCRGEEFYIGQVHAGPPLKLPVCKVLKHAQAFTSPCLPHIPEHC